jgi:hypothetical protein
LVCQAANSLDDGPGLFPVPVFVDVFHKYIIATGNIAKHWKIGDDGISLLEYWNKE